MMKVIMILVFLALLGFSNCLSFSVEPRKEECFFEKAEKGTSITVMFQVISGGQLDIDLIVNGPDGVQIMKKKKNKEGRYSFNAPLDGFYSICFNNRMSTFSTKAISVEVESSGVTRSEQTPDVVSPLGNEVQQLYNSLNSIKSDQKYMKLRNKRHQLTNENTGKSMMWWTLFETVTLIGAGVFQVYYLKRFFESRRSL